MDNTKATELLQESFAEISSFSAMNLPIEITSGISKIIYGDHLTFRYMLFTALLAKATDASIHPRAVQAQSDLIGAYDARSLCHAVVVPFDKNCMGGAFGKFQ